MDGNLGSKVAITLERGRFEAVYRGGLCGIDATKSQVFIGRICLRGQAGYARRPFDTPIGPFAVPNSSGLVFIFS